MYFERHLLVKIGSLVTDTGISMKGFLPGTRTDTPTVSVKGLAPGTYPVEIGLAAPGSLAPDITLAITGTGPWYTLGNLVVGKLKLHPQHRGRFDPMSGLTPGPLALGHLLLQAKQPRASHA
jgi:hypothetical protein